ncbi:hypothetical protein [Longibacter salinarum]|uniref:hypothetical protein n=1 Tax=Longibacter salinarum TaxID=1850348 RepID=UPI0015CF71A5|nr:hypothetical protein [Longibacter salinarum]
MMNRILDPAVRLYDWMDQRWEGARTRRSVGNVLLLSFFVSLIVIELSRQGLVPGVMGTRIPTNHFYAIDVAFTLFLVVEVVGLVFGLATSVADALGKQFEIFSLILLRQSFKELVHFSEPIQWGLDSTTGFLGLPEAVLYVVVDATGALLIFAIISVYYRMQQHRPITDTEAEQARFVAAKKLLSVTLLAILGGLVVVTAVDFVIHGRALAFFDTFYTILIFSDVLIVLISLRYSATYHVVFRNSAFAAATVMIRLALAGPRVVDAALGIIAAGFAVGLTAAYNRVAPALEQSRKRNVARKGLGEETGAPPPPGELEHEATSGTKDDITEPDLQGHGGEESLDS